MRCVSQYACGGAAIAVAAILAACSTASSQESVGTTGLAITDIVKDGEHKFNHSMPTGNGRACATCHIEADGFTLKPETVEARFQARARGEGDDDPLFRAVDADNPICDDGHGDGDDRGALPPCTFDRLRQGLARVTIPLPANITVDELPGARSISLFRAVPSVWNVAMTAPYLLDGRADVASDTTGSTLHLFPDANHLLQEQGLGAAQGHIQIRKTPPADFFPAVAAYELDQFSSTGAHSVFDQLAAGGTPKRAYRGTGTNPSPISTGLLSADELAGQQRFEFRCGACHGGPRLIDGFLNNFRQTHFFEVSVSARNLPNLPVYTFRVTQPNGTVKVVRSPDPGRLLITGTFGLPLRAGDPGSNFEGFDTPTLYGIGNTAPYFHDNSAKTLEDVMVQYNFHFAKFKASGSKVPFVQTQMTAEEKRIIVVYLKGFDADAPAAPQSDDDKRANKDEDDSHRLTEDELNVPPGSD